MKLWLLKPIDEESVPWNPWYDKCFGFVIRTTTEEKARKIADENHGDENRDTKNPWLNPELSSCEPLTIMGSEGIVIKDFASA
ncbi:MAG TPA: hypothetical protein ENH82_14715 [bacterium]|nr:hypothetical protein [bacterium]